VRCINSAGGYPFFTPTAVETNRKYADFGAVTLEGVAHYASCGRTISNVCGSVGSVASINALSAVACGKQQVGESSTCLLATPLLSGP